MQAFTDTKGDVWDVEITLRTLKNVKRRLSLDMFNFEAFFKQAQDPIMLCDLLYLACQEEAEKRGISDEAFGGRLGGTSLRDAKAALLEAYINFIPDPIAAEKMRVVKDRYSIVGDKILKSLEKKMPRILEQIDAETDRFTAELEKEIDRQTFGK